MPHQLPDLPFGPNDLEPFISAETLEYHHGKHHKAYVDNLNKMTAGTPQESASLEELIKTAEGGVFNNAAQVWNHTFYWHSMTPNGGGEPPALLKEKMKDAFGSVDECKDALLTSATSRFASGWAWLVLDNGTLKTVHTGNAQTPLTMGMTPLVTIDVWEHAYYLDYQNRRKDYAAAVLDKLINWEFALQNTGW